MPALTPIIQESYNDTQRAYIAGFLLWYRRGFLRALESVSDPAADVIPSWRDGLIRYYADAEKVTRYLLWNLGYPVARGAEWDPEYYPTDQDALDAWGLGPGD